MGCPVPGAQLSQRCQDKPNVWTVPCYQRFQTTGIFHADFHVHKRKPTADEPLKRTPFSKAALIRGLRTVLLLSMQKLPFCRLDQSPKQLLRFVHFFKMQSAGPILFLRLAFLIKQETKSLRCLGDGSQPSLMLQLTFFLCCTAAPLDTTARIDQDRATALLGRGLLENAPDRSRPECG